MLVFSFHIIPLVAPFLRVKTSPFHLSLIFTQNVAPGLGDHEIQQESTVPSNSVKGICFSQSPAIQIPIQNECLFCVKPVPVHLEP